MRIAVLGAGGVGGYFGARLAQAGEEVTFIARGRHLEAIRAHGLRVESALGDVTISPARATDRPEDVGPVDLVLVAVKTWQVPDAAARARPLVGPDTAVLPLENGVEAADQAAAALGREHVLGGVCQIVSFVAGPGVVRHAGLKPHVELGELDRKPSERAERIRAAFARAGVSVRVAPDIHAALWRKLVFIASLSGVGAVTRAPAGVVRAVPDVRRMLEAAMHEVATVARARGVAVPDETVAETLAFVDRLPPEATASMQRDLVEGRPSELEAQNGAVVRLGAAAGVPTPVHAFLYASLLPAELRARGKLPGHA